MGLGDRMTAATGGAGEGRADVLVERHGGVAVLTLNDPERRNVLSAPLVTAMSAAFDEIESDPAARCVIVTGTGPAFCAGADLSTLQAAAAGDFHLVRQVYDGFLRVRESPLATIAAVNGPAVGAGFNLALACDVRLGSDRALFDTRFAQLRIHPGGGHAWMLTRTVGLQQATLASLFGEVWDAEQAVSVGLLARRLPADELLPAAIELGRRLDGQEAAYTRRLVATLRSSVTTLDHGTALAEEAEAQEWSTRRPAFAEGVRRILSRIANRSGKGAEHIQRPR